MRLANAVFTALDPEAATFARTKYHRSQTTPESFELSTFERDHLGAWVHLSPGFDLGGDSMFRVTGCGCAQVIRGDDTATATMILSRPHFLRSHFHFLPPIRHWPWSSPSGSGDALLALLDSLARQTGHPELFTTRVALFGFSAAGSFAVTLAARYPERTLAAIRSIRTCVECPLTPRRCSRFRS